MSKPMKKAVKEFTKRKIGPDDRVVFFGRLLEYVKECDEGVFLKNCDDGPKYFEMLPWRLVDLQRSRGNLEIEYGFFEERNARDRASEIERKYVTDLDPDIVMRAKMVLEFLEAEEDSSELDFTVARSEKKITKFFEKFRAENEDLVEEVRAHLYKKERKRKDPFVGPRHFRRLVARFEREHLNPASLDWRYEERRSASNKFTQGALAFAYKAIAEFHTPDQHSFVYVHDQMVKANAALPFAERHAELPSATTLWRMKRAMGDFVGDATRGHDKHRVEREYSAARKGPKLERPLQVVVQDEHLVHLVTVLTKNGLWDYLHPDVQEKIKERDRIWISVDMCEFSRSVVGIKGLMRKPDAEAAIATLAMCAQDKSKLAALVGAQSPWPQGGTPEAVRTDAGPGYVASEFQAAVMMYTGRHSIPPSKHPHLRGIIERFFRSLNQRYIHLFSGQTFSSILHKDSYDPAVFRRGILTPLAG